MRDARLFLGLLMDDVSTTGETIRTRRAGSGHPLLLFHGYPETHIIWHTIVSRLAERFTVVLIDLHRNMSLGGTIHATKDNPLLCPESELYSPNC